VTPPSRAASPKGAKPAVRETLYKGWKALEAEAGRLKLVFTPGVGGRITGCLFDGRSLFFTDPVLEGKPIPAPGSFDEMKRVKRERGFCLYGGYKTWLSPQGAWPDAVPYYDLDSGPWTASFREEPEAVRVTLESPVCRESGVRLKRSVFMGAAEPRVAIEETIENAGARPVRHGLWDVIQLVRPGFVYLPVAEKSRFEDGIKVFREETPGRDAALRLLETSGGMASVRCTEAVRFKFGTDSPQGWIAGFFPAREGRWIVFGIAGEVPRGASWGHGCSAEVFNSDGSPNFEMEIHGPVRELAPGETFRWRTRWAFGEADGLPRSRRDFGTFVRPI
jgi:hypothetical protein